MSSCDDDFALLRDDPSTPHHARHGPPPPHHHHHHHHHQQLPTPHGFVTPKAPPQPPPSQQLPLSHHPLQHPLLKKQPLIAGDADDDADYNDEEDYGHAFAAPQEPPCFVDPSPNEKKDHVGEEVGEHRAAAQGGGVAKRREREDLSDDGASPYGLVASAVSASKKPRASASSSSGDYRKDREEWSDSAIGCLLDAYTDKYVQLNRGNLRGRDWEEVATIVSDRCDKQKSCKTVEQCKNKVDNLKKRYKAERQRLSSGSLSVSHWPWFKKMEQIVGFSSPSSYSKPPSDDDKLAVAAASTVAGGNSASVKQLKRCTSILAGTGGLTPNLKMKSLSNPRWRRVVFKISGATFTGEDPQNIDPKVTMMIAKEIAIANHRGVEVAIVVGGSNFFCGDTWATAAGIDRTTAYQIGMMATVMNSILLQACLEKIGIQARVQTAFAMQEIAEPYIRRKALRHLEKARVVIFGGVSNGTGSPLINTDTAAVLKASEINADAVLKGTEGDNMYDCPPRNNNATTFEHISFRDYVSRGFNAIDMAAVTFCEENNIPVVLFNLLGPGNVSRALCGEQVGTLIDQAGAVS